MNISELRRIEAEATPGPWEITPCWDILGNTDDGNGMVCQITTDAVPNTEAEANAALIVAMRNALPELLKVLDRSLPQEPTDGMIEAGEEALLEGREWGMRVHAAEIYRAMVKAHGGVDVG